MTVRIISTDPSDIDGLNMLLNQWDSLPVNSDLNKLLSRVRTILNIKNHVIFVYHENSIIQGYLYAGEVILLGNDPYIEIHSVLVDEHYRGRGIGKQLVRHCEQWSADKGFYRIVLSSRVHLYSAHKFYLNLDYKLYKESYCFHKILNSE